ncbi:hypothetical protein L9F63_024275, partial [Diploptera punctata]
LTDRCLHLAWESEGFSVYEIGRPEHRRVTHDGCFELTMKAFNNPVDAGVVA